MIDERVVENIRTYGVYQDSGAGRSKVFFEDLGVRADQKADYVILTGCVQPEGMPHVFLALRGKVQPPPKLEEVFAWRSKM